MENGINEFNCHEKNYGVAACASTDLLHYGTLQDLFLSTTSLEEELLSVINTIVLSMKDKDLAYRACSPNCRGRCIRQSLVKLLQLLNYDAAVCSSKWSASGKMPGGEYEYVDVILEKGLRQSGRLIVDMDFQSHFEIARPTQSYLAALRTLPVLFVGSVEKLTQVLQALAEAAKLSMRQNAMPVPPWRTLSYMTAKWLSPYERHVQKCCEKGSNSLGAAGAAHTRSTEQCIQQLHHLKMCLLSTGFC